MFTSNDKILKRIAAESLTESSTILATCTTTRPKCFPFESCTSTIKSSPMLSGKLLKQAEINSNSTFI